MNINLTLIGQMIAFSIFMWFCMKFVWPPLIMSMEARQKKLSAGLQDAEQARVELENAKSEADEMLGSAKQQAAELIESANKRANQLIDDAKQQARAEGERLKTAAQGEIEQEVNRAKEELRSKVAALSIAGAEKILEKQIDSSAHSDMLDKLAASL